MVPSKPWPVSGQPSTYHNISICVRFLEVKNDKKFRVRIRYIKEEREAERKKGK